MTPAQLKQIGYGLLAFADERAGVFQHGAIAIARARLDAIHAADLFAWLDGRGFLPASRQGGDPLDLLRAYRRRVLDVLASRGPDPINWCPSIVALEIESLPLIEGGNMPQQPKQQPAAQTQQAGQQSHQQTAAALGIDLGNIDWTKVLTLFQFLIHLFGGAAQAGAPGQAHQANPQLLQHVKADCHEECSCCIAAASHALESARISIEHVQSCQQGP
jgi:hypothetical protein